MQVLEESLGPRYSSHPPTPINPPKIFGRSVSRTVHARHHLLLVTDLTLGVPDVPAGVTDVDRVDPLALARRLESSERLRQRRFELLPLTGPAAAFTEVQGRAPSGSTSFEGLGELISSIASVGVLQPVLVEEMPGGRRTGLSQASVGCGPAGGARCSTPATLISRPSRRLSAQALVGGRAPDLAIGGEPGPGGTPTRRGRRRSHVRAMCTADREAAPCRCAGARRGERPRRPDRALPYPGAAAGGARAPCGYRRPLA